MKKTTTKKTKRKGVVIDVPKELIKLTNAQKAKLRSAFRSALVEVVGVSSKLATADSSGDEEELNPIIQNT